MNRASTTLSTTPWLFPHISKEKADGKISMYTSCASRTYGRELHLTAACAFSQLGVIR